MVTKTISISSDIIITKRSESSLKSDIGIVKIIPLELLSDVLIKDKLKSDLACDLEIIIGRRLETDFTSDIIIGRIIDFDLSQAEELEIISSSSTIGIKSEYKSPLNIQMLTREVPYSEVETAFSNNYLFYLDGSKIGWDNYLCEAINLNYNKENILENYTISLVVI